MLPQLLALAGTFTLTLATAIFHPPKGESFLSIDYRVGIPLNTTTPDGVVGTVPVLGGDIKGKFNGHIVGNITSSIERALVSTTGVYTVGLLVTRNETASLTVHSLMMAVISLRTTLGNAS